MRKMLFLAIAGILSVVQLDGFAAVTTRGNARGSNVKVTEDKQVATQPTAARAATRGAVKTTNTTQPAAVRSATKQVQQNTGTVAARAGAKQKVINTGTKVASATENTAVPQDCQDAFFGCMDAFCMLDNASGGRCQCSDRITELDKALEEILKLDEQTYIMATEGVERIQMGEDADQIMARAKAAGDKAVNANKEKEENAKKSRQLDLSVWNTNIFSETDDVVDILDDVDQNYLTNKKGDALYKGSREICAAQFPTKCRSYGSMLQLIYAQKIKSDCTAYENSLKAQKSQSQQKLQTAQKALRDAALEEYRNQNKYATTGECVVAFTQCMQTTAECGEDYTGCVTLAAAENVRNNKSGSKAKQTTIKSAIKGADITLAASTMEQLLSKKVICEKITKQCVNSNKNDAVWDAFLHNAAPALKSAELIAEQNLRSSCIPTIAKCFQEACKSNFGDGDSYDMCLSNPLTYKSLCKVQLEPCLEATGGTIDDPKKSSLWNGVVAMLSSMKVDACTNEVKTCLTDRCGEDFAQCVGLPTDDIIDLCPSAKLTACMDENKNNENDVRDYVAKIAQGLALQIDNALLTACQNAANEAMIKVCGDTESCENANFDLSTLESGIKIEICKDTKCVNSLAEIQTVDDNGKLNTDVLRGYYATLQGAPDISYIKFANKKFTFDGTSDDNNNDDDNNNNDVVKILQNAFNRIIDQIDAEPQVAYCTTGREVQGFKSSSEEDASNSMGDEQGRFPNLTDSYKSIIADSLLSKLSMKNAKLIDTFTQKMAEIDNSITEKIYAGDEQKVDNANRSTCESRYNQYKDYISAIAPATNNCGQRYLSHSKSLTYKIATYNPESNVCVLDTKRFDCIDWGSCGGGCKKCCKSFNAGTVIATENIQMAKSN